mgnify:CR=1 FL=1
MLSVDDFKAQITKNGGLARSNLFAVVLPNITDKNSQPILSAGDLNVLCLAVGMPGRNIVETKRVIGLQHKDVSQSYSVEPVSFTFHMMNNYKIRTYFEAWQDLAVNQKTYNVGYYNDYTKTVTVKALRKGFSVPLWKNNLDFLDRVPSNIKNRLPTIGPIDLSQGEIDLAIITPEDIMYQVDLINAFPGTMQGIDFSDNNANGLIELTVQMQYENWTSTPVSAGDGLLAQILSYLDVF